VKTATVAIGLLASLAAAAASAAPPPGPPSYNQRLQRLDPPRRAAALRAAIAESGQRCGRIDPPLYRGPYKNLFFWAARCTPGGDYALYVGPDGSVQVRDCAEAERLKLPSCGLPPARPAPTARRQR
jgi:hypothetical protein